MNRLIQPRKSIVLSLILLVLVFFGHSGGQTPFPSTTLGRTPIGGIGHTPIVINSNTAIGTEALSGNQTGRNNTADGFWALYKNTSGTDNTGIGYKALFSNTGSFNTAVGSNALYKNDAGSNNTAVGYQALQNNDVCCNTAFGSSALQANTTGQENTANGYQALQANTTGSFNTANGHLALQFNTTGYENTAVGVGALRNNTVCCNTAVGTFALIANTIGGSNAAFGDDALEANTTGGGNVAAGQGALGNNTAGQNNTAIGFKAGSSVLTANNVICIGSNVVGADVSNTTWIGNVYTGFPSGDFRPVIVGIDGHAGSIDFLSLANMIQPYLPSSYPSSSSERFKKDIATMDKVSEAILSLRPITFHYKSDAKETPQFGLIAEEVAKVDPALVLPDKEGKPYTVRYDAVNAMLLNEFLKEHRKNEEQEATIARLEKQIETLTAGLQKVSAQLETSKPAPHVVLNKQ